MSEDEGRVAVLSENVLSRAFGRVESLDRRASDESLGFYLRMQLFGAARRIEALERTTKRLRDVAATARKNALATRASVNLNDSFNPNGFYVYALWGKDDACPLYVGQSTNVLARLGSHLGDRNKRGHVERVTLIRCRGPREMDLTERELIKHHRPPWNTVHARPRKSLPTQRHPELSVGDHILDLNTRM